MSSEFPSSDAGVEEKARLRATLVVAARCRNQCRGGNDRCSALHKNDAVGNSLCRSLQAHINCDTSENGPRKDRDWHAQAAHRQSTDNKMSDARVTYIRSIDS